MNKMDVLVTGNIKYLNKEFFLPLVENSRIILCGAMSEKVNEDNVIPYTFEMMEVAFENLFITFQFEKVILFSEYNESENNREIERLNRVLTICGRKENIQVVYVCPSGNITAGYSNTYPIVKKACEDICKAYAKQGNSLLLLEVPWLPSEQISSGCIRNLLIGAIQGEEISFPGQIEGYVDALFQEDLAEFFYRFFEDEEKGYEKYFLSGSNHMTLTDLTDCLCKNGIEVEVKSNGRLEQKIDTTSAIRLRYGWYPKKKLLNSIPEWIEQIKEQEQNRKNKKRQWFSKLKVSERLLYFIEFVCIFLLCEFLNRYTRNFTLINFVDFRLLFVIVSGMMYGLKYGIISTILACASYLGSGNFQDNWQIQFYNIINWIPFAVYMISGTMAGYTRDRYKDLVSSTRKEQRVIEDKYVYLNELYIQTLQNKDQFSNQIVNYRNSFGRIYAVTRQLYTVLPGAVFYEAVNIIEDMLETSNCAIYVMDKGSSYARLNVCSRNLIDELTKSRQMNDFPEILEAFADKETWINRKRLKEYPDYAYPIFREDNLAGMIMVQSVPYVQMNMDYLNRFNILSGLIADALVRAMEYQELKERDIMVENTRILKYEPFKEELAVQFQLREKNQAGFMLFKINSSEKHLDKLSEQLSGVIRKHDIIGMDKNNKVYLLLTQAGEKSVDILHKRLEKYNITFETADNI